jgi:hypothetical protein
MGFEEVVRRWQRAIARATGLACETFKTYLAASISLGLSQTGPPTMDPQLIALRPLVVAAQPVKRVAIYSRAKLMSISGRDVRNKVRGGPPPTVRLY